MFKRIFYFVIFCAIALASYFIYIHFSRPFLEITNIKKGHAMSIVYGTGVVESRHSAIVSSLVPARIVKFYKKEGDFVSKDDVLAELDNKEVKAKLAGLTALEHFLSQEVKRQKTLIEKKFTSTEKLEDRVSQLAKIKADIEAIKKNIDEYSLKSPIDGQVIRRENEEGEVITGGKRIFWIGQPKALRINAEIDEESLPELKPGQKVWIKADAYPKIDFEGIIEEITPLGNSQNKNYRVYIGLEGETPFSLGMTVEVNVLTDEKQNALLVPNSSLKKQKIWVVDNNNIVTKRKVTLGIQGDELSEIIEGLQMGDHIVLKYRDDLQNKQKIRSKLTEFSSK